MIKQFREDLKNEFNGYSFKKLGKDALAGITVGAVALPLALAFAIASGADAAAGLVTAIISGIVMSLLSGASFQISGPTGAMTAVLVTIVARHSLSGMFITCLIAGIILLLTGILRLGKLVELIPTPVIMGFTSGIAIVIALGQVDNFFGTRSSGQTIIEKMHSFFTSPFNFNIYTIITGVIVIVIMIIWPKKWSEIVPSSLAAITVATAVSILMGFDIPTVGEIPKTLLLENRISLSGFDYSTITSYIPSAFTIAALGAIESLLCASSAGKMKNEKFNSDRELVAQGIGNIVMPFFGGVPSTAAIARTSVAVKSGGQTRLTGVFHSLFLIVCIFVLSPLMFKLPLSALSGVLIVTAWRMNDWKDIRYTFSKKLKGPITKFVITMLATVIFDLTLAIISGIIVALVIFVHEVSKIHIECSQVENDKLTSAHDLKEIHNKTIVVYVTGPVYFANIKKLTQMLERINDCDKIILSMRGVPLIDITAISAIYDIYKDKKENGCKVVFCGLQQKVSNYFKRTDFYDKIGNNNFYWSVDKVLLEYLDD